MNKLSPLPALPGDPTNSFEEIIMPFRLAFWVVEIVVYFVSLPVQLVLDLGSFLNSL